MKHFNIIRYLLVIAFVFYLGLYSAFVLQSFTCQCHNCVNQTNTLTKLKERSELIGKGSTLTSTKRVTTLLLVIVLTGPDNVERRNMMRSTWLNLTNWKSSVSRLFVIGTAELGSKAKESLEQEQKLYGDMLFLNDFKESYKQLTQKLLKTFLWISSNVHCSFVMKVDDDSFARLDMIISELNEKYLATANLYWGFHRGSARVKYFGPWQETKWMLCDYYLPYALRGGYIISMKLVHYVANISSLIVLYNSEDVSLG